MSDATPSHYHIVALFDGDGFTYTDALTQTGALDYAADYIQNTPDLAKLWIVESATAGCPLELGDDVSEGITDLDDEYIRGVLDSKRFWNATV